MKKTERKKPARSVDDIVRAADAAGVSYGRYVQMLARGEEPGPQPPKPKPAPLIKPVTVTYMSVAVPVPETPARRQRGKPTADEKAEAVRAVLAGECLVKEAARRAHVQPDTVTR